MKKKLFLIRQLSPNISKHTYLNELTDFKRMNGIDRHGYDGGEDGFTEYRVKGKGWPVYPFFGTEEELRVKIETEKKFIQEGGYTVCIEVPPQYISKKIEDPSRKLHLRINEVEGLIGYVLDAQVELGENGLFFPDDEITTEHDPNLLTRVTPNSGFYGESVVYDPGNILSFETIPLTLIFTGRDGKVELTRQIEGRTLSEKELHILNPEVIAELQEIKMLFDPSLAVHRTNIGFKPETSTTSVVARLNKLRERELITATGVTIRERKNNRFES